MQWGPFQTVTMPVPHQAISEAEIANQPADFKAYRYRRCVECDQAQRQDYKTMKIEDIPEWK